MTEPIVFRPIGVIRTPYNQTEGMPIQATAAVGVAGRIELDPDLAEGLADLDGFSHLTLLYHLHVIASPRLTVTPFLDDQAHGIFATRSPARPNPIGLSAVRLIAVSGSTIEIEDVDMVGGTPLLDIKPYVPAFDDREDVRVGWFASRLGGLATARADDRFATTTRDGPVELMAELRTSSSRMTPGTSASRLSSKIGLANPIQIACPLRSILGLAGAKER